MKNLLTLQKFKAAHKAQIVWDSIKTRFWYPRILSNTADCSLTPHPAKPIPPPKKIPNRNGVPAEFICGFQGLASLRPWGDSQQVVIDNESPERCPRCIPYRLPQLSPRDLWSQAPPPHHTTRPLPPHIPPSMTKNINRNDRKRDRDGWRGWVEGMGGKV